jgi:hypothetical protein
MLDESRKIWSDKWDKRPRWLYPVNCLVCNKEFFVPQKEISIGHGKFCSRKCFHLNTRRRTILNCDWCKKEYEVKRSQPKASKTGLHFCGKICKDAAQCLDGIKELHLAHYTSNGGISSYRTRALRHHGKICKKCKYNKDERMLDAHHKDGNRGNNKLENLEVLCVWCHALETRKVEYHQNDGVVV